MLSECMAPRLAEARHSISVDFDARVLYAIKEAKARQSKQREEREAHERRRAAIAKQEVLDRELARQRETERRYGATRRRREIATERLGRVFAVQEHAAAGGVVSPTKVSVSNQHGAYGSGDGAVGAADGSRGELNRLLLVRSSTAQPQYVRDPDIRRETHMLIYPYICFQQLYVLICLYSARVAVTGASDGGTVTGSHQWPS